MEQPTFIALAAVFLTLAYVFRRSKRTRRPFLLLGLIFGVVAGASAV